MSRKQKWGKKKVGHVAEAEGKNTVFFFSSILCSSVQCSLRLFIGQNGGVKC